MRLDMDTNALGAIDGVAHDFLTGSVGPALEGIARRLAPVRSGDLRDSIGYEMDGDTLIVGTDMVYADEVELGTSDTPAQPYLRPALTEYQP